MSRRRKKPKSQIQPSPQKTPKSVAPSFRDLKVKWSFSLFDAYRWDEQGYKGDSFCEIAKHMRSYESMTWRQIASKRDYNHSIPKNNLIKEAQKRLKGIKQEDIDELWRFRFTGEQRLWGIREIQLFKILWWDPQHKICPSRRQ